MNSVSLQQIMKMPNAAILAERINSALAEEKAKREHFYQIIEENKKMEFINGEIIYQKPSSLCESRALSNLLTTVSTFVSKNNLGEVTFGKILVCLTRNAYEPDLSFFENQKAQNFSGETEKFPAPDFVVEVLSPSTEEHDCETKFQDYAAHGVEEYWIVDPELEIVEQYVLNGEEY